MLVIVLRIVSILAFAGPMMLAVTGRRGRSPTRSGQSAGDRAALVIVLSGIVPTFAWRAHAEEKLLSRTFGERYAAYRERSEMIIPYLL